MKLVHLHEFSGILIIIISIFGILLSHHHVKGQANKVSSKLDFDDNTQNQNSNNNNTNVTGLGQGNNNDGQGAGRNYGGGSDGRDMVNLNTGTGSGGSGSGKGPKIHGVRVTVDTGDGQNPKESKESVEITDLGKHKKRVGIHTDITFEITTDGDTNETSSGQHGDKEDASVPIFKGHDRGRDSKHKSRKPYDPKSQWNPHIPVDRHGGGSYGGGGGGGYGGGYDEFYGGGAGAGGGGGGGSGGYYPQTQQHYPQHNVPIYSSGDTGTIYRSDDGWSHYVPVWTTERSPSEQSQVYRRPSWKPCYCMSSYGGSDYRRRRASSHHQNNKEQVLRPTSGIVQVVDSKLEQPFS